MDDYGHAPAPPPAANFAFQLTEDDFISGLSLIGNRFVDEASPLVKFHFDVLLRWPIFVWILMIAAIMLMLQVITANPLTFESIEDLFALWPVVAYGGGIVLLRALLPIFARLMYRLLRQSNDMTGTVTVARTGPRVTDFENHRTTWDQLRAWDYNDRVIGVWFTKPIALAIPRRGAGPEALLQYLEALAPELGPNR